MQNKTDECKLIQAMLFDYTADALGDDERAAVLLHINSCPDCMRELTKIQSMLGAAAEISDIEIPAELKARVSELLKGEDKIIPKRRKLYFKNTVRIALPIAACTVLAVGIFSSGLYDRFMHSDEIVSSGVSESGNIAENPERPDIQDNERANPNNDADAPNNDSAAKEQNTAAGAIAARNTGSTVKEQNTDVTKNNNAPLKNAADTKAATEAENISKANNAPTNSYAEDSAPANKGAGVSGGGGSSSRSSIATSFCPVPQTDSYSSSADITTDSSADNSPVERGMLKSRSIESDEATPVTGGAGGDSSSGISAYSSKFDIAEDSAENMVFPSSCVVITDNPSAFASSFGIKSDEDADEIIFKIAKDEWEDFVSHSNIYGAEINAEFDGEAEHITITVKK